MKERHKRILEYLEEQGACSYQDFSELLGVTTMTIRRDCEQLVNQGLVIKTLGGVQRAGAPSYFYESPLRSRISVNSEEKRAIGLKALELVSPGKTLFLDGSTTCLQLASLLAEGCRGLTIITNSALVALTASSSSENMVVCIGGQIDKDTASFVGPTAEQEAKKFFVDFAFISTKGFITNEGTFESAVGNLHIKRLIVAQSSTVVLLVDHSKVGLRALCEAVDISQIHMVITDDATPNEEIKTLKDLKKKVLVATVTNRGKAEGVGEAINAS